jgi:hypothetical protein
MSTPIIVATTNNTSVVITTTSSTGSSASATLVVDSSTNKAVVVQENPRVYNAGSGILLQSNIVTNDGVLTFNNRKGHITLLSTDILTIDGGTP